MIKRIWSFIFRKKKVIPPIIQTPVKARSLGFCMIFAGSDLPSLGESYFKLEVEQDDLMRFKQLPEDIAPVAFLFSYLSTSKLNINYKYSCILIHEKNNEVFIYVETKQDGRSELSYINNPIKETYISEYMNEELVDFCGKIQLNFELKKKLNPVKAKKLQKI